MAYTSRLTLAAITLGAVLLLISNNAKGNTTLVVRLAPPRAFSGSGRGVLGHVEFDLIDLDVPPSSPPPAAIPLVSPPPPPPPAPVPLLSPPPSIGPPQKACAPGCEVHGTCNRELGRCDCPPLRSGPACELNIVPSCRSLWGLDLPIPPCQALSEERDAWRDFPPTCECLAECHALNLRVVYVDNCVNVSQREYVQGSGGIWEKGKSHDAVVPHPWRDVFGDGRWLRQAYKPGRHDVQYTEAELTQKNLALASRLFKDGAETKLRGLCSGRGLYTEVMPWWRRPPASYCHCFPGWYGTNCEYGPGDTHAPDSKQYCVCVPGPCSRLLPHAHLRRRSRHVTHLLLRSRQVTHLLSPSDVRVCDATGTSARGAACASSTFATASPARGVSIAASARPTLPSPP